MGHLLSSDTAKPHGNPVRQEQASFNVSAFFHLALGLYICSRPPKIILLLLHLLFAPSPHLAASHLNFRFQLIQHSLHEAFLDLPKLGYVSYPNYSYSHYTLNFPYHNIKYNCLTFIFFLGPSGLL